MKPLKVDLDLVQKYNVAGPRYTSYPPATKFTDAFKWPDLASLPPEKLVELVCEDLRVLLGVKGKPVFTHHHFWPRAIPQYNVGYGKFKGLLNEIESKARGLFFAGSFRDGVSLGDSIVSGCNAAGRLEELLKF